MAGGNWTNPKKLVSKPGVFSSEVLKDSPDVKPVEKKFSLRGILGLGESIEIHQKWGQEFFGKLNHLQAEEKILLDGRQKELEKRIAELRDEIAKLTKATDNLDKQVENVALNPVVEANTYQLNFLERIRIFIADFRKNISEAGIWLEAFAAKRKKRNYFWNMVKSKKGGDQFLFSNESSLARSAT